MHELLVIWLLSVHTKIYGFTMLQIPSLNPAYIFCTPAFKFHLAPIVQASTTCIFTNGTQYAPQGDSLETT